MSIELELESICQITRAIFKGEESVLEEYLHWKQLKALVAYYQDIDPGIANVLRPPIDMLEEKLASLGVEIA